MVTTEMLLKQLIRAYAHMRRDPDPTPSDNGLMTLKTKGFGSILDALTNHDGITQTEIAELVDMRQQSVSEAIEKLVSYGYVRKEKPPKNKRSTLIYLTEEGKETQKELKMRRKQMADAYFSCLTDAEKDALFIILSKLSEHN